MKRASLLLALVLAQPALACEDLQAERAWIREAPPGARVMAGYVSLRNTGREALRIVGFRSAAFESVEIHRTVMVNNQMQMLHESDIVLKPGEEKWLAPGGFHLMLFKPRQPLAAGAKASIEFACEDAARTVDFPVRTEP